MVIDGDVESTSPILQPGAFLDTPLIPDLIPIDLTAAAAPNVDPSQPLLAAIARSAALASGPESENGPAAIGIEITPSTEAQMATVSAGETSWDARGKLNSNLVLSKSATQSPPVWEDAWYRAPSQLSDAAAPQTPRNDLSWQDGGGAAKSDPDRMALLAKINARINSAIIPALDMEAFGANDVWALPLERGGVPMGNCKHYALEKREALVRAGVPASDVSIAIVRTPYGEMHAILLVRTDAGEVVLDNLTSQIKSWRDVNYTWLERQTPGHPLVWVSLNEPQRDGRSGA